MAEFTAQIFAVTCEGVVRVEKLLNVFMLVLAFTLKP